MADLLRIRARDENGRGMVWSFVDTKIKDEVELDAAPTMTINDGDVWQVELVDRQKLSGQTKRFKVIVRLISKVQEKKAWQELGDLPDFWMDPDDLKCILIWLNSGTDIILIGDKGTGKTTLAYQLAKALGWEEPCKIDVYTIKKSTDLFGTDAASNGSTHFVRSSLLDYIERARIAHRQGLDSEFIVILDEINRVHSKANESMHGLFDDTRQVSIVTTEGPRIIKLPPNIHFIGTMNLGSEYVGTYGLDDALKDRFAPIQMHQMPFDYEVNKLVSETNILETQAKAIVTVVRSLREAAKSNQLSFSPSYRICRNAARLVAHGLDLKKAVIKAMLGWYDGELKKDNGELVPVNPNSEMAKAFAALRMKGVVTVKEVAEALGTSPTGT